jgi:hypothetical protein
MGTKKGADEKIQIQIIGKWKKYQEQTQASLIDGSYCLSNQSFIGSQTSLEVNVINNHPGEHWEEIKEKGEKETCNLSKNGNINKSWLSLFFYFESAAFFGTYSPTCIPFVRRLERIFSIRGGEPIMLSPGMESNKIITHCSN